jgi:Cache 3/Cache 2 fusion domain
MAALGHVLAANVKTIPAIKPTTYKIRIGDLPGTPTPRTTLFVKGGDEYIRVATSVPKPDGSGRATGTVLAGPALEAIKQAKAYYGDVPILGVPYTTGYEPIKASSGEAIGVYYVGYKK